MNSDNISIELSRVNGILKEVSISNLIWTKQNSFGSTEICLPFLGIYTSSPSENEIDVSIEEAIKGFCIACEKYGKGLESELESIGWINLDSDRHVFNIAPQTDAFDMVLKTGHTSFHTITF